MKYTLDTIKIPNFDLTGKVAVITGGTKGLGYGIAATYASYGADVVVAARTAADCERVAEELKTFGHRTLGIPTDVTNEEQVKNLVAKTVETFGKIDIMVCNGGTSASCAAVDMPLAEWNRVVDIDMTGVFLCAREAAKQMIAQGNGGRIINMASAGVVNLTRALAQEWARYNITVNCICPGYVATDINEQALANPKVKESLLKKIALRRFGTIDEIAAGALYLASDFSGFMSGAFLRLDGGGQE